MPNVYIVGHIDWSENELRLEKFDAFTWQDAVRQHSKYPWKDCPDEEPSMDDPERFKQTCFDCDCMMSWIEV